MNTKTKEGARNKGNSYFLRVPWNKGGLVNTGPVTVNCRPTASNYQLSHLRPCREPNAGLRGGRRECYHSATVAPPKKTLHAHGEQEVKQSQDSGKDDELDK